jgi:hypothetical protein
MPAGEENFPVTSCGIRVSASCLEGLVQLARESLVRFNHTNSVSTFPGDKEVDPYASGRDGRAVGPTIDVSKR